MDNKTIYYVSTETEEGGEQSRQLIRAASMRDARIQALSIVTIRRATQDDMLLALPPSSLPIEDAG